MIFFSFSQDPNVRGETGRFTPHAGQGQISEISENKKKGGMGQFCLIDAKTYGELIDFFLVVFGAINAKCNAAKAIWVSADVFGSKHV